MSGIQKICFVVWRVERKNAMVTIAMTLEQHKIRSHLSYNNICYMYIPADSGCGVFGHGVLLCSRYWRLGVSKTNKNIENIEGIIYFMKYRQK